MTITDTYCNTCNKTIDSDAFCGCVRRFLIDSEFSEYNNKIVLSNCSECAREDFLNSIDMTEDDFLDKYEFLAFQLID